MKHAALALLLLLPQDDLKAKFEAKRAADPLAAFKLLADAGGEPAAKLARPALAQQITADTAAGLKAWAEAKGDVADVHLVRAALLAAPYSPDFSRQLLRTLSLLKVPRKTVTGCGGCKGAGSAPCAGCKDGLVLGPCPRCEAKGTVACVLCDGSGTLDHHGYKGQLVLTIERDTRVPVKDDKGKTRFGTLPAQVLTYGMASCAGGSFNLQTRSVVTKTNAEKTGSANQTCETFWKEMRMFAFSGKAKIKVNDPKGQMKTISSMGARRFFGDYEICSGGRVPCDRCAGKKSDPCSTCQGKTQAMLLCAQCEGTLAVPCTVCKGVGDVAWLTRLLPQAPVLAAALNEQAAQLKGWLDERSRAAFRKADVARRLDDAKKGADATAKFSPDVVDIVCPKCKGSGGECEECWGGGRREFSYGTGPYERYALIDRLTKQVADLAKAPAVPPALAALPLAEADAGTPAKPVTPVTPLPGGPLVIPKSVEEMLRKADTLYESGKVHLEKSKASNDNAVWIEEGLLAVKDLRDAQTLYASAQETLDATGQPVPRELQMKFRTNMQALVMARKQVP
ncbi:MAG TPA: hypothetical protein VF950_15845 [Planctomycetota bacterium]